MIMRGVISRRIDWREVRRAVAYVALAIWLVVLTVTTAVQSWLASAVCATVGSAAVLVVIAIGPTYGAGAPERPRSPCRGLSQSASRTPTSGRQRNSTK